MGGVEGGNNKYFKYIPPGKYHQLRLIMTPGRSDMAIYPKCIQFEPMHSMQLWFVIILGATNLMASKNLEHSFNKLASKKMKVMT